MRHMFRIVLALLLWLIPAHAAEDLVSVDVALGDVSINKVPFLMAADNGIYERNGLDIHQFVTPNAAEVARNSGVVVPPETVREDIDAAPLAVDGGSPTIYRAVHTGGIDRVILATQEGVVKSHHRPARNQLCGGFARQAPRLFQHRHGDPCRASFLRANDGVGSR